MTAVWLVGVFAGALAWGPHAQAQVDRARPVDLAMMAKAGYEATTFRPAPITLLPGVDVKLSDVPVGRDLDCLAAAVYYEARGESALGQAAVAQVVLNRVRHPAFPKSVCGVVYQSSSRGCQFSFVCNGAMHGKREPDAWVRAEAVAARALGGYVMAEIGEATQFHATRLGGGGPAAIQLGHHVFFGLKGRAPALPATAPQTTAPATASIALASSLSQGF